MSFPSSIEDPTLILSVTQIAQDDDGFDLASRDSLDLGEDLEAGEGDGAATPKPPAYDYLPGRSANNRDDVSNTTRPYRNLMFLYGS